MDIFGLSEEQAQRIKDDRAALRRLESRVPDTGGQQQQYRNCIRPCKIVKKGGSPGGSTPTDTCSYVYDVTTLDGATPLLANASPLNPFRVPGVRYRDPGGNATYGEITIIADGTLNLWNAFEVPDFAPCSSGAQAATPPAKPGLIARLLGFGGEQ